MTYLKLVLIIIAQAAIPTSFCVLLQRWLKARLIDPLPPDPRRKATREQVDKSEPPAHSR